MAMKPGDATGAPPLSLPVRFFLAGLTGMAAALLVLLGHMGALLRFQYGSAALLAATHLMTLGFISMVMMGAMYQLVPVVFNAKLYSVRLAAWHYAALVPGVALMVSGFLANVAVMLMVGGSLVVLSIALFLLNLVRTLPNRAQWGLSGWFVATALGYLGFTVSMGWLLAWNLSHPFLPGDVLAVHLVLGGVGWFALALMGVSYKLLPMFSLTHAKPRWGWAAYGLLNAGVWIVGVGTWWWPRPAAALGSLLAAAALALYAADIRRLWRRRLRRQPDPAVYLALAGTAGGLATMGAAAWGAAGGPWSLVVFMFFYGWMAASILGYLQKIVPFLVWLHRYGPHVGRMAVPRMRDLLHERWSWMEGAFYAAGTAGAALGLATATRGLLLAGLSMMLLAVLWLLAVVIWVLWQPTGPATAP